jgi:ABC-type multidrug transport system fused ATPase/permease subunit
LRPAEVSNWGLIRRMLALAWQFRGACWQVFAQQTALVCLGLFSLGLTGLGIDVIRHAVDPAGAAPRWPWGLSPPADWSTMGVLTGIAAAVAGFALLQSSLRFYDAVTMARLVQEIVVRLRSDVYAKLGQLSFRFFGANASSSLINRVAGDVQAMRMFVDGVVIEVVTVVITLAVYLGYMLNIHVKLTLVSLATTPLLWLLAAAFSRAVKPAYRHNRELSDQLIMRLAENIQGITVVKGFGLEREEIDKFATANHAVRDHKRTIFWKISMFQPTMYFFTKWNMAVLLGYGGYLVINGELLLGEGLFVFANLLQQFANQIEQVTNITNSIQASLVGAQRVFEVLDAPVEVSSPPEPERAGRAIGAVRFEGVSFGYGPAQVLEDVDFEIQPGQCVAVVGATGAGKSTLLSLIPRFYDASAGRVLIDGVDLRSWQLEDLRRSVAVVFQEPFLFSHTVAANIAFGHPEATREQIERAARIAAAHEFIAELPHGYDTIVGENGANLSGGQRQRLALARAVLTDPAILLLDDATSSVDADTEHAILDALDAMPGQRTTFIVAHRQSTIERADLVLVLDQGRIVHFGTQAEVLAAAGATPGATTLPLFAAGNRDAWKGWREAV